MPLTAAGIMTRNLVTARPEDTVAAVAKLLSEHGISAVPVCDKDGKVLGIVSEGDLMRPFGEAHALRRAWWLNLLAEGTELAPDFVDYLRMDRRRVSDLMATSVVTAPETATVRQVADMLDKHKVKRIPIVRDGKLVGIVSRADVVRALARSPESFSEPD